MVTLRVETWTQMRDSAAVSARMTEGDGNELAEATLIAVIGLAGVAIFSVTALATTGGGVVGTTQYAER